MKERSKSRNGKEEGPERNPRSELSSQKGKAERTCLGRKKVLFVSEDHMLKAYSFTRKFIFDEIGVDGLVEGISGFLEKAAQLEADVLIVDPIGRFSASGGSIAGALAVVENIRNHPIDLTETVSPLKHALTEFRRRNPDAYVVVCATDYARFLKGLLKPPMVINEIETQRYFSGADKELVQNSLRKREDSSG